MHACNVFVVLCVCLISGALGQYYFVTVPNVIRYEHDTTVIVSVFDLTDVPVNVWLQLGGKKISEKQVIVKNEASPEKTHVRLTEKDLANEGKPSLIEICSKYGSHSDCQDIVISYETGYIIIQTDKPIYTPKQEVKIRALVFDESLKAVNVQQVRIDIISPSNLTLGRQIITNGSSGFFIHRHAFDLPPHAEIGLWTVRAFLKGQFDTNARALFSVEEYVLPTFGVEIEVDLPFILNDSTQTVSVTVKAKYVYGKPVNGKARLELNLRGDVGADSLLVTTRQPMSTSESKYSVTTFKISVAKILESKAIGSNQFPDGKTLECIATVYEDETGNEENAIHGGTIFTTNPYKFNFSKSKRYFRPGMEYFLKLEILLVNGAPASDKDVELIMLDTNDVPVNKKTDSEGKIIAAFQIPNDMKEMKFQAIINEGKQWKSDEFTVSSYVGDNQIQVEMVTVDGSEKMRAYTTNVRGSRYTGLLFLVVSRGEVVNTQFKNIDIKVSIEMNNKLKKTVSPSGRLIAFYVDKNTGNIVADSTKFNVRHECRGTTLSLESAALVKPGDTSDLTITGDPNMFVGLNIMDKALLLLNNKNVMLKNVLVDMLESHDIGCGEGSGVDGASVFKNAGLTVLTNAKITKAGLQRNTMACDTKLRKKRQALDDACYSSRVNPACCEQGFNFAEDELEYWEENQKIDPLTVCYQQARKAAVNGSVSIFCIDAMFLSCLYAFDEMIQPEISGRTFDFTTDYQSDLNLFLSKDGIEGRKRNDFRESWKFTLMPLDRKGKAVTSLAFPQSITEWMIQGIGISNEGVCVAEPVNVTAFKKFFIQLELPYKATRLEHLEVKATIFNYGRAPLNANVYLSGINGLCYDRESGQQSKRTKVVLEPNSAQTILFPMVAMISGLLPVTVTALVYDDGSPVMDEVEKRINVENEGIKERIAIQVCLDPLQQANDCKQHSRVSSMIQRYSTKATQVITVNLTPPQNIIPTTGTVTAYLQGNIMDNVVRTLLKEGVDSLFKKPGGCAEQNMVRLAPTVSAMNYLKQTKQVTDTIEETGNNYIRNGVKYQISTYRKSDGSYAAYSRSTPSTWLTAFVTKVFCQADMLVNDAVNHEKDIGVSIAWLLKDLQADGSFMDENPVRATWMMGQTKNKDDPSLTAFILVALQECSIQVKDLNQTISKAVQYLEGIDNDTLKNNPYILALSTYALALTKSDKVLKFKDLLHETKINTKDDGSHWGDAGGFPANAYSVETTAYALLAMLQFDDIKTSGEIVRWLTSQRDSAGAFQSTQDTVVGLQALSEYSMRTYVPDIDLKVTLSAPSVQDWKSQQFSITHENSVHQKIIKNLPVEKGDNRLIIQVSGRGTGRMMIDFRYNRPAKKHEICGFNVSDITTDDVPVLDENIVLLGKKHRNCDVCNKCDGRNESSANYDNVEFGEDEVDIIPMIGSKIGRIKRAPDGQGKSAKTKCVKFSVSAANRDRETGMTLVKFGLETGVEVVKEDLDKLTNETENIDAYEYDGNGFVVFYLASGTLTNFIFRLTDTFNNSDRHSRQPAALTIYDYYNPDQKCTKMYRTVGESFSYQCDNSEKPQCVCLQSVCVEPSMGRKISKSKNQPAAQLRTYTCNSNKADYAVKVKVVRVWFDQNTNQEKALATVLISIHNGSQSIANDTEMTFYYPEKCNAPSLKIGEEVYIIGKDGNKIMNGHDDDEEYHYPLTDTALVIKQPDLRRRRYTLIMQAYERLMTQNGCEQK